jgi:septum formation protein
VYLASASPRRRELLAQIGVQHSVHPVSLEETALPGEAPADYVRRLAGDKAARGWQELSPEAGTIVLGADTAVVADGAILGKPAGPDEAAGMLAALSGRRHEVFSAVSGVAADRRETLLSRSAVTFRDLTAGEIRRYVATGEPLDKAGAYGIQGLAAVFVADLAGSYSGVMGLPLFETAALLASLGLNVIGTPA